MNIILLKRIVFVLGLIPLFRLFILGYWITGFSQWVQLRKTLGLFTFFYGFLHFTIWYWLDHDFNFTAMISDVIKRPFITMGFIALLIMSLLAITSNQTAIRLLGVKWKTLHRFIYLIAILAVIHYFWHKEGKRDFLVVYIYTGIIFSLLFIRIPLIKRFIKK